MKAKIEINDPLAIVASVTLTMSVRQWQELRDSMRDAPFYGPWQQVRDAVRDLTVALERPIFLTAEGSPTNTSGGEQ